MSVDAVTRQASSPSVVARLATTVGRQRELSLVFVMVVLGVFVAIMAPRFLGAGNLKPVATLAAIIAIAAVGEAMVIITRNVDLSVESIIGLVAFVVADMLAIHALDAQGAMLFGVGLGLVLGMINGFIVTVLGVPAIVATLGTLSIYRGIDFVIAGGHQVTLERSAAGLHGRSHPDHRRDPAFRVDRPGRGDHQRPSSAADALRPNGLRRWQQP